MIAADVATDPPLQENIFHVVSFSCNAASAAAGGPPWDDAWMAARRPELAWQAGLIHDIFGGLFHTIDLFRSRLVDTAWLTPTVTALTQEMYESRDFARIPVLADALQEAGCEDEDILLHCQGLGPHTRGCWVLDRLLGRE